MSRIVRYRVQDGRQTALDLDRDAAEHVRTYADLIKHLIKTKAINQDHKLVSEDGDSVEPLDQPINFQAGVFRFEWTFMSIYVKDAELNLTIKAGKHSTVEDVKKSYQADTNKQIGELSYKGKRLDDRIMLKDLGISEGDTLLGKITVIVEDSKCDLSISVQLYEFSTIRELKSAYAEATRRITSAASMINFHDRQNLGDDETLDGCGISDMEKVLFENPSYDIKIVDELEDGKIETHINVADHWTVSQVKEAFSRETRQALVAGDKLVFGGVNLEDTDMLFQHSVDHMSELLLVREDSSRAIVYECAECGSDVRLKRYEPIRCRSCGCRIVFKKRTTRRKFIYCNLFHS